VADRPNRRRYDDGCAAAHALDLIGERWALLVARELMLGPRRFTDLRSALPGISPNVLTQRLEEMEAAAILTRRRLPPPAAAAVYELTEWGYELEPLVQGIGRWAARSPTLTPGKPMSIASVVLSFRTMFDPDRAGDLDAVIVLVFGVESFVARIAGGSFSIVPGRATRPDAVVTCEQNVLAAVVYGGLPLDAAIAAGDVAVTGDLDVVRRFTELFPLPARAPAIEDLG
jgi:DNA-binding HxlR family transcriptional regulator